MSDNVIASRRVERLQWRLILVIFVLAFAIGLFGEITGSPWPRPVFSPAWFERLSDDLFYAILYFTFSAPQNAAEGNLALNIARFLAPLATVSAIIKVMIEAAYASWLMARVRSQKGHVIVIGFGALGQQIAQQFLNDGKEVLALDRRPSSEASEFAGHLGLPLIIGDGTRPEDLEGLGIARASSVFFVTDNDIVNLEACAAASSLMSGGDHATTRLLVHLGDINLSQQLQDYERRMAFIGDQRTSVSFFNLNDLLARQLLSENPLHRVAWWLVQDRIHVLLIGINDISRKIIQHTILTQRTQELGLPHFTVIDPKAETLRVELEAALPDLGAAATFDFIDRALDPNHVEDMVRRAGRQGPITATVLCLLDEVENLTAALRIHSAAARGLIHAGNIMVRRDQTSDFFERLSRIERYDLANMLTDFGEGDHALFVRQITGEDDDLPRKIHEAYCKERAEAGDASSPSTAPWEMLAETARRANRRAADHLRTKLMAAGYRIAAASGPMPPLADNGRRLTEPETREKLAKLEHDRWWTDRVMDGWHFGEPRNNSLRIHPDLKPYEELTEDSRLRDAQQIDFLAGLLSESKGAKTLTPPELVIGVSFNASGRSVDATDAASELHQDHPDMVFLVVAETFTTEQEAWLATFAKALDTPLGDARLVHLFEPGDEETLGEDDESLWLNLKATGAETDYGYPKGLSLKEWLARRADLMLSVSL